MAEVNLTRSYPKGAGTRFNRDDVTIQERMIARSFGMEFFDGERKYGCGGYRYNGCWIPVVKDFIEHYKIAPGWKVLDVGCAKGFFLYELMKLVPGVTVRGIDISAYAIEHALPEVKPFLDVCCVSMMPFKDKEFDLVVAIGSLYSLDRDRCKKALQNIERVSRHKYVQVASWRNIEERDRFRHWQLTSGYYDEKGNWVGWGTSFDTAGWKKFFAEAGYTGDYYWTIIE